MIIDVLGFLSRDRQIRRNLTKTCTWAVIGTLDTILIAWVVTSQIYITVQIGLLELLTKAFLYYIHERVWQKSNWQLISRRHQALIIQKEIRPSLFKQTGKVKRRDREELHNSKSFTIWLTGLSAAGKSTLAAEIEMWMHQNKYHTYILDGDNTRLGINSDLSFTDDDRTENIRRVAEICRLFNEAGIIVIASFISPFIADRSRARTIIGNDNFFEVYLEASISVCRQRDKKGLYTKALEGRIKNFTGISSPYEPPPCPDLHIHTDITPIPQCLAQFQQFITDRLKCKEGIKESTSGVRSSEN